MTELPKIIVLISKSLIRVAKVEGNDLQDPIEMEWKQDLLRKAFSVVKSRYQTARIRLVLDSDLSHTLDLTIPIAGSESNERQVVEDKIREMIPEVLTAGNWDYKVKQVGDDSKVVTVFVPVQEHYLAITDAAAKEGLEIEAVEPISISLERDPNPFIGMAKKTDLRGDDEEVLNLQPVFAPQQETGSLVTSDIPAVVESAPMLENDAPLSNSSGPNKFVVIGIAALLVVLLGAGVVYAVRFTKKPVTPSPTPAPIVTEPSPSPLPSPVALSELKVEVLNGSGIVGQAGVVNKLLTAAGFSDAKTGNASNYKYTDTIVSIKSSVPMTVLTTITDALAPNYSVKQGDPLDATSDFDVIVTVGTSKATPSTTPKPSVKPSPSPSPKASSSASPSPSSSASPSPSSSASPSPSHSPSPSPSV